MKAFFRYLDKKRLAITNPFLEEKILDVGCGPATTYYLNNIKEYVGIERGRKHVMNLRKKFPLAEFYDLDLEKDKFNFKDKFDTIILLAVIEHIKNPDNLFRELKKCLNQDGKIVITTPTPIGNFIHDVLSKVGITSKEATREHVNIYDFKKFFNTAEKYGLKVIKYKKFQLGCNSLTILKKK